MTTSSSSCTKSPPTPATRSGSIKSPLFTSLYSSLSHLVSPPSFLSSSPPVFYSTSRHLDPLTAPGPASSTGITRDLTSRFKELQRASWQQRPPRKSFVKRLITAGDELGLVRFLQMRGLENVVTTTDNVCVCGGRFKINRKLFCEVCHHTVCSACLTVVFLLPGEDKLRAKCCKDCAYFVEECLWRSMGRHAVSNQVEVVYRESSEIHTWLWKDGSQLEGLLRLVAHTDEQELAKFPADFAAVIGEVWSILSTCILRLQVLFEEITLLTESSHEKRTPSKESTVREALGQYILLVLKNHKPKLTMAQLRIRQLKRTHPLFMKETLVSSTSKRFQTTRQDQLRRGIIRHNLLRGEEDAAATTRFMIRDSIPSCPVTPPFPLDPCSRSRGSISDRAGWRGGISLSPVRELCPEPDPYGGHHPPTQRELIKSGTFVSKVP